MNIIAVLRIIAALRCLLRVSPKGKCIKGFKYVNAWLRIVTTLDLRGLKSGISNNRE